MSNEMPLHGASLVPGLSITDTQAEYLRARGMILRRCVDCASWFSLRWETDTKHCLACRPTEHGSEDIS
jgi:hypothetical protein